MWTGPGTTFRHDVQRKAGVRCNPNLAFDERRCAYLSFDLMSIRSQACRRRCCQRRALNDGRRNRQTEKVDDGEAKASHCSTTCTPHTSHFLGKPKKRFAQRRAHAWRTPAPCQIRPRIPPWAHFVFNSLSGSHFHQLKISSAKRGTIFLCGIAHSRFRVCQDGYRPFGDRKHSL